MKIVAVGDIMPGGLLNKTTKKFLSDSVLRALTAGELRVGTLETAVGNTPSFYEEKMNRLSDVIYVEDEDLLRLKDMNINIVSLANNHFFDLGPEGAKHTIELLDQYGIMHCGAGMNLGEAQKPVVITTEGKSYAFVAFCDYRENTTGWSPIASETEPGVNPMYEDYAISQIVKYKSLYDYVIAIPHWGVEHTVFPIKEVYSLSRKMIDAGASLVLGSHPHIVQPVVPYKNGIIAYSMGNFLFPDRLICPPRSTYYPSDNNIEIENLPETYEYPYVDELTLKKWLPTGKIGMIVKASVEGKKVSNDVEYVILSDTCFLDLSKEKNARRLICKVNMVKVLLMLPCYSLSLFGRRVYLGVEKRLKHLMETIIRKK